MKKMTLMTAVTLLAVVAQAQVSNGKQNVEKLCGCFDVEFKYAETFSPDKNYKFHERERISGGTELALPIEVSDKKIVIQHLLIITDSMIIKHWRDEWTYENPVVWNFKGDNTWEKQVLTPAQVKGNWTQTVWEVSDAPRYQGSSNWVAANGKIFWQNTADAPLPRREYSKRDDYNILKRQNTIILTDTGWIHDQDNQKIIRANGTDKLLAEEKGVNRYKKIDEKKCAAAKAFWEKSQLFWAKVRKAWEDYLTAHNSISLKTEVDGLVMHDYLNEQAAYFSAGKLNADAADQEIRKILAKFIIDKKTTAALK